MMKRAVLRPTKINNGAKATTSKTASISSIDGIDVPGIDAGGVGGGGAAGNPVINDMIHKLSERMNSAQVEVHLLVNDTDDVVAENHNPPENGRGDKQFSTPRKGDGEKPRHPPISNIDSVSLPSSRSSSFSSSNAPPKPHHRHPQQPQQQQQQHQQQHHNNNLSHTPQSLANYSLPLSSSAETVVPATTSVSDHASNSDILLQPSSQSRPNHHVVSAPNGHAHTSVQQQQQHHQHYQQHHQHHHQQQQQSAIPPFTARSGSNVETVYKNYEMLVTRLCSLESTIQSLKLKLASKEVMRECKECFKKSEKLGHLNDAYEKDLQELRGQIVHAKGEVQNERVLRQSAEIRVKHAESMLDSNTHDKAELSEKLSSMNEDVINLRRIVAEASREVEAERTVRMRLEESHSLLLRRIQEMDSAVDSERKTVSSLSVEAIELRKKTTSMDQQMSKAKKERNTLEEQLKKSKTELAEKINDLLKSEAERKSMVDRLKEIQSDMNAMYKRNQETQSDVQLQTQRLREAEDEKEEADRRCEKMKEEKARLELELETLRPKVGDLSDKNVRMLQEVENLRRSNESLTKDNENKNNDVLNLRKSFTKLNEDLKKAVVSKESLEQNAQSILQKLDHKADAVLREKAKLEAAIAEKDAEIEALADANAEFDKEVTSLRERVVLLQQQEVSQEQLQGLMDRCAQLSYEKGELESQVEQYRERTHDVESLKLENEILENEKTETGEKLGALERQVKVVRENCEQLKHQLLAERRTTERKEEDFQLALRARDEALDRVEELRDALREMQKQCEKRDADYHKDVDAAKKDGTTLAASLEKVVSSHSQLQATVEELQRELGRKNGAITKLENELKSKTDSEAQLKSTLAKARSDFTNLDYRRETEVDAVKRELHVMMEDNKKLAASLQLMINANDELRVSSDCSQREIQNLQDQLERTMIENEEEKAHHEASRENEHAKWEKEREKLRKRHEKETNEVRAENSKLASRCVELRKTSDERVEEIEKLKCNLQVQKDKLASLKTQMKALNEVKEKHDTAMERITQLESELEKKEKSRKSLEKSSKIYEERAQIAQEEASRVREDMNDAFDRQRQKTDAAVASARAEIAEEKEKYLALKAKYKTIRKSEKELRELNEETASKLQSAHDESLQISTHLKEAGEWFRTRFDELQRELLDAQRFKETVVKERKGDKKTTQTERKKMDEVMGTASAMLAASRVAVARLTDEAEANQQGARSQLLELQSKMKRESERAKAMEEKYRSLKETSSRHVESLAQELAAVKGEGPVEEMVNEFESILSAPGRRRRSRPISAASGGGGTTQRRSKDAAGAASRGRSSFALTSTPNDKRAASASGRRKSLATVTPPSPSSPSDTAASSDDDDNDDEDSNEYL